LYPERENIKNPKVAGSNPAPATFTKYHESGILFASLTKEVSPMGWRNTEDFKAYCGRRSKRGAARGIELESKVEEILQDMVDEGLISSFTKHQRFSFADRNGMDFTVRKGGFEKPFGVTISARQLPIHKGIHPEVPQFYFPVETKTATIRKRVLGLFDQ